MSLRRPVLECVGSLPKVLYRICRNVPEFRGKERDANRRSDAGGADDLQQLWALLANAKNAVVAPPLEAQRPT